MKPLDETAFRELASTFGGELIRPGDHRYESARRWGGPTLGSPNTSSGAATRLRPRRNARAVRSHAKSANPKD